MEKVEEYDDELANAVLLHCKEAEYVWLSLIDEGVGGTCVGY